MKIKTVSVRGLFGQFDHKIELSSDGVTFIHSQNGAGKSTTLKLILDLFSYDIDSLKDSFFDSMHITSLDGTVIDVVKGNELSITIDGNEASAEDIRGLMDVIYLSPERIVWFDGEKIVPSLEYFRKEIGQRIKDACSLQLDDCESDIDHDIGDDQFLFLCKDIKARLDFISENGINLKLPSDINFPPTRYDLSVDRGLYLRKVSAIERWANKNYTLAESISAYQDIINGMFNNKKIFIEDGDIKVRFENGVDVPLMKLSAGEKQILIIFYRLLFHCSEGSLAIVDEPEISLHVSWQQKLGELFLDISRVRDVQIIVATHSPQVIHDLWDLSAELRPERA